MTLCLPAVIASARAESTAESRRLISLSGSEEEILITLLEVDIGNFSRQYGPDKLRLLKGLGGVSHERYASAFGKNLSDQQMPSPRVVPFRQSVGRR
ncbi:MAG: hypothetical protein JWR85_3917 [Marmoricola sp.]|nr:hypothetical protein [Marmoricola sp.]